MRLQINDTIKYSCAAGNLTARINNIVLSLNAAGKVVPWIDLAIIEEYAGIMSERTGTRICATDESLKMLKVELV